jgi:tRNA threonylcarbamoyladenosine biosynthesis protein TsaB
MNILALDTCTELCSAAILTAETLYIDSKLTERGHSDMILSMMDRLLAEAKLSIKDIDVVAFGRGPGSFTGVRVGVGVAQGIAFAHDIPVVAVSSLAAVAQYAADTTGAEHIAVAMDARMNEIYCASYRYSAGFVEAETEEKVCPASDFVPAVKQAWFGAGTAWSVYEEELKANFDQNLLNFEAELYPHASAIAKLAQREFEAGRVMKAEQAVPVYLRDKVAKKKAQQ